MHLGEIVMSKTKPDRIPFCVGSDQNRPGFSIPAHGQNTSQITNSGLCMRSGRNRTDEVT